MSDKDTVSIVKRFEQIMDRAFPFKFWFWTMLFSPTLLLFSNTSNDSSGSSVFYLLFFIMVYSVIFSIPSFVVFYWAYSMMKKHKVAIWWLVIATLGIPVSGLYLTLYVFLSGFKFSFFMYYLGGIILSFCWLFLIGKKQEEA